MAARTPRGGSARSRGGQADADLDARDYGDEDYGDFDMILDEPPPDPKTGGGARGTAAHRPGSTGGSSGGGRTPPAPSRTATSRGAGGARGGRPQVGPA